jgi:putative flippase GtrA
MNDEPKTIPPATSTAKDLGDGDRNRDGRATRDPYTAPVAATSGLRSLFGTTGRMLLKELSAFGIVGIVCFLVDVALLQLFYAHLGIGAVTSKVLATLISMTLAYFAHRYWSFSHRARTNPRREYVLFALINGSTLLLGAAIVGVVRYPLGQDSVLVIQIANIASIVLSTALRYLAYRKWVFPAHKLEPEEQTEDAATTAAHTVA